MSAVDASTVYIGGSNDDVAKTSNGGSTLLGRATDPSNPSQLASDWIEQRRASRLRRQSRHRIPNHQQGRELVDTSDGSDREPVRRHVCILGCRLGRRAGRNHHPVRGWWAELEHAAFGRTGAQVDCRRIGAVRGRSATTARCLPPPTPARRGPRRCRERRRISSTLPRCRHRRRRCWVVVPACASRSTAVRPGRTRQVAPTNVGRAVASGTSTYYAASFFGDVFRSTDSGDTWSSIGSELSNVLDLDIAGNTLALADYNGYTSVSTDGGANWTS